jgi:hypothetical protein
MLGTPRREAVKQPRPLNVGVGGGLGIGLTGLEQLGAGWASSTKPERPSAVVQVLMARRPHFD